MKSFRALHPGNDNYLVAPDVIETHSRTHGDLVVRYVALPGLMEELLGPSNGSVA